MRPCFISAKLMQARLRPAGLAVAGLMALIVAGDHAGAAGGRGGRAVEFIESRAAGEPILAVVSLRSQRITVYDAEGWIFRAPVSSGQKGRETPAGIFSVIQKNAEHYSNLYDDAYMPHMQRLTWSGIALHGGALPGYPASHGCVRLPFDFAARLFEATRMGTRVILAPGDAAPVEIAHPALFASKPGAAAVAAARAAEASEAARKADQARLLVVTALREAARAGVSVRIAENLRRRAEEQLAAAEDAIGAATSAESKAQAEAAKAEAVARIAELQVQWTAARAELQPKLDAIPPVRDAAVAAEAVRAAAAQAAREVALDLEPVSVFVSRKTQRLYIRRGFEPLLESEVTILQPDRPIGTHVFTAMERLKDDASLRWSVVSLDDGSPRAVAELRTRVRGGPAQDTKPVSTGQSGGATALDRIVIPQDALERISGMVSVRSSLIISDEEFSPETSKGTDFIVVLSGEPQGSMKIRRGRTADARY